MAKNLRVIPLGGLGEIGKNMTVYEYGRSMIVVDCGVMFPDSDMYGIDLVLPDFSYILKNQDRLKGILLNSRATWNISRPCRTMLREIEATI
jgi:ribonuclease J